MLFFCLIFPDAYLHSIPVWPVVWSVKEGDEGDVGGRKERRSKRGRKGQSVEGSSFTSKFKKQSQCLDKNGSPRTSLVVQWPKLHVLRAGGSDLILDQESRSHMPQLRP